jgi:hypothetical protein
MAGVVISWARFAPYRLPNEEEFGDRFKPIRIFDMTRAPKNDLGSLKTLDTKGLTSIFPDQPAAKNSVRPMDLDTKLARRVERRRFVRMEKAGRAAEHLGQLPGRGETIHSTMSGAYDGWALVGAVLQLAQPATIDRLDISTLGYNRENSAELFAMLDDGRIRSARFLASTYFRSVDPEIYETLRRGLASRGQELCICRVHSKTMLFTMTDGRTFTIESSANLRSCRNLETFSLSADPELLAFHQDWMTRLVNKTAAEDLR